jgi:hypothetical protein
MLLFSGPIIQEIINVNIKVKVTLEEAVEAYRVVRC